MHGKSEPVPRNLCDGITEVTEAHRTTGEGDLLCRVVALGNAELAVILDRILEVPINRTTTALVLDTPVPTRVLPAIDAQPPTDTSRRDR